MGEITLKTKVISAEDVTHTVGRRLVFDGEFNWDHGHCIHGISTRTTCGDCDGAVGIPDNVAEGDCGNNAVVRFLIEGQFHPMCATHAEACRRVYGALGMTVFPQALDRPIKCCQKGCHPQ